MNATFHEDGTLRELVLGNEGRLIRIRNNGGSWHYSERSATKNRAIPMKNFGDCLGEAKTRLGTDIKSATEYVEAQRQVFLEAQRQAESKARSEASADKQVKSRAQVITHINESARSSVDKIKPTKPKKVSANEAILKAKPKAKAAPAKGTASTKSKPAKKRS